MDEEMKKPWRVWEPDDTLAPWTDAIAIVVDDPGDHPEYPVTTVCWFTRGWNSKIAAESIVEWHNENVRKREVEASIQTELEKSMYVSLRGDYSDPVTVTIGESADYYTVTVSDPGMGYSEIVTFEDHQDVYGP